jgi:hypothetical protein
LLILQIEPRVHLVTEFDITSLYIISDKNDSLVQIIPRHPTVATADVAIKLFGLLFPLQNASLQESILETLIKYSKYAGVKSSGSKKLAIQFNSLVAIMYAFRSMIAKKGSLASERIPVAIRDLVEVMKKVLPQFFSYLTLFSGAFAFFRILLYLLSVLFEVLHPKLLAYSPELFRLVDF